MSRRLRAGIALRPTADGCEVLVDGRQVAVRWSVPCAPRADRVDPGHLLALGPAPDGGEVVLWRWYDAVVLGEQGHEVLLWEPAHGEVRAQRRRPAQVLPVGSRAYASAGLPGADWWVTGPEAADVELDEVAAFYDAHGLWELG